MYTPVVMKCVADITYDMQRGLALDLFVPDNLQAHACVIYAHGGGFRRGERSDPDAVQFAKHLTDAGFAVASVSYRLNTPLEDFPENEQKMITAFQARSVKVGLKLKDGLMGAAFTAVVEDLSHAIEFLWVEGEDLGIMSRKVGVLGVSAGGLAALALAYPPTHLSRRVSRPDSVVAISAAFVQPWRLEKDGPPCLLINGPKDPVVGIENAQKGATRAQWVGAPVKLMQTNVQGHTAQVDAVLDGMDAKRTPYMTHVLASFERLRQFEPAI